MQAKAQMDGTGGLMPGKVFMGIPAMDMEQLKLYKEFNNADYTGPDLPFTRMSSTKRTWNGIHFMTLPDDYFTSPDSGTSQYMYMWHSDCIGVENNWGDIDTMEQVITKQGNPWMIKVGFGAASVGILPEGVKEFRFKKLTIPARPA